MMLTDIAMLAGETTRAKAYLQAMLARNLHPAHVLIMASGEESLPGQRTGPAPSTITRFGITFHPQEPLEETLARAAISWEVIPSAKVNSPEVLRAIAGRQESVFIYSGYGGGILRKRILALGKRFLHVHGGYLPDYKGSTTNYYSLINEGQCGASALFLTANIDSGPILMRRRVPAPADPRLFDHEFESLLRASLLIDTLEAYLAHGKQWRFAEKGNAGGETYFIMHPVLRHIALLHRE